MSIPIGWTQSCDTRFRSEMFVGTTHFISSNMVFPLQYLDWLYGELRTENFVKMLAIFRFIPSSYFLQVGKFHFLNYVIEINKKFRF